MTPRASGDSIVIEVRGSGLEVFQRLLVWIIGFLALALGLRMATLAPATP